MKKSGGSSRPVKGGSRVLSHFPANQQGESFYFGLIGHEFSEGYFLGGMKNICERISAVGAVMFHYRFCQDAQRWIPAFSAVLRLFGYAKTRFHFRRNSWHSRLEWKD